MAKTLSEIALFLNAELRGDPSIEISSLAPLDKSVAGEITFLSDNKYIPALKTCEASAVILTEGLADQFDGPVLVMDNPYLAFAKISHLFDPAPKREAQIHPTALISESASVGKNVVIGPYVVVEDNAVVGDETELMAHVVIGENSKLGKQCRLFPRVTVYHGVETVSYTHLTLPTKA